MASKAAVAVGAFVGVRQAIDFGKDVVNTGKSLNREWQTYPQSRGATGAELTALSENAKEMGAKTKFSAIEASGYVIYEHGWLEFVADD